MENGLAASRAAALASPPDRALVDRYCVTCHNDRSPTGGLTLEKLGVAEIGGNAATWEKVVRKLRAGAMPPPGAARPETDATSRFVSSLEHELDLAAASRPDPDRPPVHRLNRGEYANAIRDLLALDIDGAGMLPADNTGYGFDNIADVLSFSPGLLERYMIAAQKVSRLAMGDPTIKSYIET